MSVPALTEKDLADLRWALITGFDIIALSFVRTADDIAKVREVMSEMGIRIPVLAKIEKPQAVANLDGIIAAFDGIMVARGDLGWSCRSRTCRSCRSSPSPSAGAPANP